MPANRFVHVLEFLILQDCSPWVSEMSLRVTLAHERGAVH
jgi:hypothetical protein